MTQRGTVWTCGWTSSLPPRRASPPSGVFWHDFGDDHEHEHDDDDFDGAAEKSEFYYADNIELTTVGIDIGSSTSHLMFSRLHLQRLGKYLSSRYVVVQRDTLHRSPILLTPYRPETGLIDVRALEGFIDSAYADADLTPQDIDSGAVILTGAALERANARAVADLFADHAGKFVCASAGHNLEAILAANGSGAVERSRHPHQTVLNVDVGGGTSKLALVKGGQVLETAATNVGGRLVAFDSDGVVTRIEPAARLLADDLGITLHLGEPLGTGDRRRLADALADCLFVAVRRESVSGLAQKLMLTPPLGNDGPIDHVTFSGGVSEYLYGRETGDYGDLAPDLAEAIRSRIDQHRLPAPLQASAERIRATVIGASQFTVQVSGNTIAVTRPGVLPLHNLPVLHPHLPDRDQVQPDALTTAVAASFRRFDLQEGEQPVAIAIKWSGEPRYSALRALSAGIVAALPRTIAAGLPLVLVFANDYGKLIGGIIREEFAANSDIISIDGIELQEFDYIDIGELIFPSLVVPVVVKSLVFPAVHGPIAELADVTASAAPGRPHTAGHPSGTGRG
jgi:ethanolamine utilization protein EutA